MKRHWPWRDRALCRGIERVPKWDAHSAFGPSCRSSTRCRSHPFVNAWCVCGVRWTWIGTWRAGRDCRAWRAGRLALPRSPARLLRHSSLRRSLVMLCLLWGFASIRMMSVLSLLLSLLLLLLYSVVVDVADLNIRLTVDVIS